MGIKTLVTAFGVALTLAVAGCTTESGGPLNTTSAAPAIPAGDALYKGTFPCRSCSGIDVALTMKGMDPSSTSQSRTFDINAVHRGTDYSNSDQHYTGRWYTQTGIPTDPQAKVVVLKPDQQDGHTYYFLQRNNRVLELISPQLYTFENGSMLRLKRQ
ncbi:hypothetical protein LMG33818_002599 [Halomonadaceae bacterium LMG 33818]|uniref:copper resistance protein NlpE N-terminal domain-containing protein n=1 Tax=Cernens ardua TaxID=3402176 RepID=UPI003EDC32AA